MARAGLNRKTALATVTMTLAAEAPDLDVLTEFHGRVFGFAHHRGITHTFVGVPFVAAFVLLVIYIVYRWRRRGRRDHGPHPRWGLLFWLACLAGLSHILLDFTNNYGVRPFEPFTYKWYSWDIVFIVEPVLWAVLLLGLLLPSLFATVDQEIRSSRRPRPRGRLGATLALAGVLAVWGVRDYEHRRALAAMDALTYHGATALRWSAYPYMINPFRWYGVVETPAFYESMDVDSLTPEVDPRNEATVYYKTVETPVTLAAKRSYLGRVYLDWSRYPLLETEQLDAPEAGYLVRFYDLRFMYPGTAGRRRVLGAWVELDPRLQVVAQSFGIRNIPPRNGERAAARPERSVPVPASGR
jgi:inner membrane protein